MIERKPLFGPLGENTTIAIVLSVYITAFLSGFFVIMGAGAAQAYSKGLYEFLEGIVVSLAFAIPLGMLGAMMYGTLAVILVMLLAVPIYKFMIIRTQITLPKTIFAALFVLNLVGHIYIFQLEYGNKEFLYSNIQLLIALNIPAVIVAVFFFRFDQGKWW